MLTRYCFFSLFNCYYFLSNYFPFFLLKLKDEFVTTLAALALYDGDAEITADNIKAMLTASGNTVAPYWPVLFAGMLKGGNIESMIFTPGSGAASGGAAAAASSSAPAAAEAPAAKEEKKKVEEVDVLDGGMDMFGGSAKTGDY